MNYNVNHKIMQITENTLIVGIDIAKRKHIARAQDFRGLEHGKTLSFENNREGFLQLIKWIKLLCSERNKDKVYVGFEPTGHYWFNLAHFLKNHGIKSVLVNPLHVKKTKELEDNSPTKNDIKDARVIGNLVRDGKFSEPNILKDVYAELRTAMSIRDHLMKDIVILKTRVHRWLDINFPEFTNVFADWTGQTALLTLKLFPLPSQVLAQGIEQIVQVWKEKNKYGGIGIKRATMLFEAASQSVGVVEGQMMAEYEINCYIGQYEMLMSKLDALMKKIEAIVAMIPGSAKMMTLPGLGLVTIAGFLSEVGDLSRYSHPRQIQKLAGLTLRENSSGQHKGQMTITKRGRGNLRRLLFMAMLPIVANNKAFKELHKYYTTRTENPLKKKQSLIALCCKLIRILFALGTKNVEFDLNKMIDDIKHPVKQLSVA